MLRPALAALLAAAIGAASLAAPVSASDYSPRRDRPVYAEARGGPAPFYTLPEDRVFPLVCRPWCNADYSPCDPAHYKFADGRCSDYNR